MNVEWTTEGVTVLSEQEKISLVEELRLRRSLAVMAKAIVDKSVDDRRVETLREYNKQLAEIDARLVLLGEQPPDIRIELQAAVIGATGVALQER